MKLPLLDFLFFFFLGEKLFVELKSQTPTSPLGGRTISVAIPEAAKDFSAQP
jgi:hypothetical protein